MKKLIQIIAILSFVSCYAKQNQIIDTGIYEDENLKIYVQCFDKANILSEKWLSIVFCNKSQHPIKINDFDYRIEYDTKELNEDKKRKYSMGQGNKFDVFPFFTDKKNPSDYDAILPPNGEVKCYRSISNYASVLLGYDNKVDINVFAQIKINGEYELNDSRIEITEKIVPFSFIWIETKGKYEELSNKLLEFCDSLNLRGNGWIITSLMRDTNITSEIPRQKYVELITKRQRNLSQYRRMIIEAFLKHNDYSQEINEFFIAQIPTADWSLLDDLNYYWDNSFLEPLFESFKTNNTSHIKYLQLFDKHYNLWQENEEVKTNLYHQVKEYAYQVLVTNDELNEKNLSSWQSWTKNLSLTHAKEANTYFKSFFDNRMKIYEGDQNLLMRYSNAPPYYPAIRVCDVALEAYIHSKFKSIDEAYSDKFEELVNKGILKKAESKGRYFMGNQDLLDRDKITIIRNELIEDYR